MTNNNTSPDCVKIPYLRAWRRWLRISQHEVERITGVSRETVHQAEAGKGVRAHVLKRLTRLGLSEYELQHVRPVED